MKAVTIHDSYSGSDDDFGDTDECVVTQKGAKQSTDGKVLQQRAITPNVD